MSTRSLDSILRVMTYCARMSAFDFYEDGNAKKLATLARDRLFVELERYHRERTFGRLTIRIDVEAGSPSKLAVTPEVSVIAANLAGDEET